MNQRLLQEIRDLKIQGLSDEKIREELTNRYQADEIEQCLQALQYMNPVSSPVEQINPEARPRQTQPHRRRRTVISLCVFAFVLFTAWPFALRLITHSDVQRADSRFQDVYDVDKSYYAGEVSDCSHSNPTRFGEVTGETRCYLTVARVYFPRVKYGVLDLSKANDSWKSEYGTKEWIRYVNGEGHLIEKYVQLEEFAGKNLVKILGLNYPSFIVFSGLHGSADENGLDGKWEWTSKPGWLKGEPRSVKLQQQITDTILANKSPAKGAPTATEALRQDKAPLVVFYHFRYCHSPNIIGLDNQCLLLN